MRLGTLINIGLAGLLLAFGPSAVVQPLPHVSSLYVSSAFKADDTQPPPWDPQTIDKFFNWLSGCVEGRYNFDAECKAAAEENAGAGGNPTIIAGCLADYKSPQDSGIVFACMGIRGAFFATYWFNHFNGGGG